MNLTPERSFPRAYFWHGTLLWLFAGFFVDAVFKHINYTDPAAYNSPGVLPLLLSLLVIWYVAGAWFVFGQRARDLGLVRAAGFGMFAPGTNVLFGAMLGFVRTNALLGRAKLWGRLLGAAMALSGLTLSIVAIYNSNIVQDLSWPSLVSLSLLTIVPTAAGAWIGFGPISTSPLVTVSADEEKAQTKRYLGLCAACLAFYAMTIWLFPGGDSDNAEAAMLIFDAALLGIVTVFVRRPLGAFAGFWLIIQSVAALLAPFALGIPNPGGIRTISSFYLFACGMRILVLARRRIEVH